MLILYNKGNVHVPLYSKRYRKTVSQKTHNGYLKNVNECSFETLNKFYEKLKGIRKSEIQYKSV